MNKTHTRGMAKVTELTRAGKLSEATALIQALLHRPPHDLEQQIHETHGKSDVIEGDFVRLDGESHPLPAPLAPSFRQGKRTGLGRTLERIASGGMPVRMRSAAPGTVIPDGAQFLSLTHSASHGRRDYRLYIPANRLNEAMPLIVMLHGCTQTPEDFAVGTGMNGLAEEFGCLIAYPAQPSGANAQKCWNWFRPEDQARGYGEPALIAGLARDILSEHAADPSRVYIAGLSAGAAAAVIAATAYPELFVAVGVHSGLPAGSAQDIPSAFAAMRSGAKGASNRSSVPTIVFHGRADTTVNPTNAEAVLLQAMQTISGLTQSTQTGLSKDGRRFDKTTHVALDGRTMGELWKIDELGHAWAGGDPRGSYADPVGPDASREMVRFFLQHSKAGPVDMGHA